MSARLGGAAAAGEVALDGELVEAEGRGGDVLARADAEAVGNLGDLLPTWRTGKGGGGGRDGEVPQN